MKMTEDDEYSGKFTVGATVTSYSYRTQIPAYSTLSSTFIKIKKPQTSMTAGLIEYWGNSVELIRVEIYTYDLQSLFIYWTRTIWIELVSK